MKTMTKLMMMLVAVSFAAPVFANEDQHVSNHPAKHAKRRNIEERVANQEKRIDRKLAKGKLTAEEAKVVGDKVSKISEERAEMVKANGGKPLTKDQRKELHKDLNETGKEIKNSGAATPPSGN